MIFLDNGKVRLTPEELNYLRGEAATKGDVVGEVTTSRELADAIASALRDEALASLDSFVIKLTAPEPPWPRLAPATRNRTTTAD